MKENIRISKEEARNFLVSYHNLNDIRCYEGINGIRQCFEQMKSIQYDPLDVVGKNADLVLQSRVKGYKSEMLYDLLYQSYELTDGFDKEMCIYETKEFHHFDRIRKARGEQIKGTLAYRDQLDALNILDEVREFVKQHGMTSSKNISIGKSKKSGWGHKKLSSAALDYLYSTGELSVKEKRGIQKYYDFTEYVVAKEILAQEDFNNEDDFVTWYIKRRIQSVGLLWNKRSSAWQGYYLSDLKRREQVLNYLCQREELLTCYVEGISVPFYMRTEDTKFLNITASGKRIKFLAPLDNMIWDRDMVHKIFDFEYRWEVYTPVVKRKYGYYVLPVLYGNELIGRFEPEKYKKDEPFAIKNWWWENNIIVTDEMLEEIHRSIENFAKYLSIPCLASYTDIIMKDKKTSINIS